MSLCVKCGAVFESTPKKTLRCNKCRSYVDEELLGGFSRPYSFYFEYYNRWLRNWKKKSENR